MREDDETTSGQLQENYLHAGNSLCIACTCGRGYAQSLNCCSIISFYRVLFCVFHITLFLFVSFLCFVFASFPLHLCCGHWKFAVYIGPSSRRGSIYTANFLWPWCWVYISAIHLKPWFIYNIHTSFSNLFTFKIHIPLHCV